jgi:hypothetical protein
MRQFLIAPLVALALTACGSNADDGKTGTDISIDAVSEKGNPIKASSDGKTGEVAIDLPGFKANIAMPKINLDADNFDIDGVKLYPGSKVTSMKVEALSGKKDNGNVRISFDAPAAPDVVKAWFLEEISGNKKLTVSATATGLTGTNEDGDPFTLDLQPGEAGHSIGSIAISGS